MTSKIDQLQNEIDKVEKIDEEDFGTQILPPKDILAFNEMRSCADLFRMVKTDQLEIQPGYQRQIVWTLAQQSRFIDSLMKSLPIPSLCFSLDVASGHRQVIDGLQRIHTIVQFLSEVPWVLSNTQDIDSNIAGKTNHQIKQNSKKLYSNVENLMIPITVIRCNYEDDSHLKYLFMIFSRLNTGGTKLSNQEIRNCLYGGKFNDMLHELKDNEIVQFVFNYNAKKIDRFELQERILRFFAFYENLEGYRRPLSGYLNDYMKVASSYEQSKIQSMKVLFLDTIQVFHDYQIHKMVSVYSKTLIEGILLGLAKNISSIRSLPDTEVLKAIKVLRESEEYSIDELREGVSDAVKVKKRLNKAIEILKSDRV